MKHNSNNRKDESSEDPIESTPYKYKPIGWLFMSISFFLSFIFTSFCIFLLLDARAKTPGKSSFTDIGEYAFGKPGKVAVEIFLGASQVGFVTAAVYFISSQLQEVFQNAAHVDIKIIVFGKILSRLILYFSGIVSFVCITPLCWIRKLQTLNWSHIMADTLIIISLITIITFSILKVVKDGWGPGIQSMNTDTYLDIIGFAVYAYEGVGVVIPVMDVTANKKQYPKIIFAVLLTMFTLYTTFGLFCYFVYGETLAKYPLITSYLPEGNVFVWIIKCVFCVNLVFSYPMVIFPVNTIIEAYLFRSMGQTKTRTWLKNLYRAVMVAFTIFIALLLNTSLGKFLSLTGALTCTPIAFTLPAMFHYKLCAETKLAKAIDITIIAVSGVIFFFCTAFCLYTWNE